MALSAKRKAALENMSLPSDEDMQQRIRSFLLRSGMNQAEFSQQLGYGGGSINLYLGGHYGKGYAGTSTLALRAAAKEYMDLFDVAHRVKLKGRHHETSSFLEARRAALNALERGTAYVIDGPPGAEKTWSLRQIEREIHEQKLGRAIYVYARVSHSPLSFLRECCASADIPSRGTIDQVIRKLRFFLATGRTLLMIDEAQHLDHAGLEVLRQLLDLPPHFGVILAGSHDLTQRLSHWQMEQWRSRLRKTLYFTGPSVAEARAILRAELGAMSDADCDETIASCRSTAQRVESVNGKAVNKSFSYISARDLFGAIERAQECLQKEGAA